MTRDEAINTLANFKVYISGGGVVDKKANEAIDLVIATLVNLPSAQPERKRGEWIDYTEDGYVECPFCHSATNCDGNKDELHFCFSCGADLKGEDDENNRR